MPAAGGSAREIGSNLQTLPRNGLLQESESNIRRGSPSLNTDRAGYTIQAGGPVAQGQSDRLITGWLEVRILPGPPFLCHGASSTNRGVSQEPPPAGDRRLGCQRPAPARRRLAGAVVVRRPLARGRRRGGARIRAPARP